MKTIDMKELYPKCMKLLKHVKGNSNFPTMPRISFLKEGQIKQGFYF